MPLAAQHQEVLRRVVLRVSVDVVGDLAGKQGAAQQFRGHATVGQDGASTCPVPDPGLPLGYPPARLNPRQPGGDAGPQLHILLQGQEQLFQYRFLAHPPPCLLET